MAVDQEQADYDAALELASEMGLFDGAKFLRAELGFGMVEAFQLCERVSSRYPGSVMAKSLEEYLMEHELP